jgi:hypothetical protein
MTLTPEITSPTMTLKSPVYANVTGVVVNMLLATKLASNGGSTVTLARLPVSLPIALRMTSFVVVKANDDAGRIAEMAGATNCEAKIAIP